MSKPHYTHDPLSYVFFSTAVIQALLVALRISSLNAADTFLVGIFVLEGLYLWNRSSTLGEDAIYVKDLFKKRVIPYKNIKRVYFKENNFEITNHDELAFMFPIMPKLIEKLTQNGIDVPKLPRDISFKMKHQRFELIVIFQILLLSIAWQIETSRAGFETLSMVWSLLTAGLLAAFIYTSTCSIKVGNGLIHVRGILRARQDVTFKQLTRITVTKLGDLTFYTAYIGKKKIFRSMQVPYMGLLLVLAQQANITLDYKDKTLATLLSK